MIRDTSHFRVLVVVPQSSAAGRMKLNGINRFLNEGHDWEVEFIRSEAGFSAATFEGLSPSSYDGIFSGWLETPEIARTRGETGIPSVHFGSRGDAAKTSRGALSVLFHDDVKAIARAAARHFSAVGRLVSYGYVPSRTKTFWSEERRVEFASELGRYKEKCAVYGGGGLDTWLKSLPKPAGVLCAFDDRAADVLAACRTARLDVPGDVSVLGIGDDALVCERTNPRLSSIAVDYEEQGYRAARELHAMMLRGRRPAANAVMTGAATVVARASTLRESPAAALVRRANAFIAANAESGITPADVVRHVRVSRRLLDLRFSATTGKTVGTAIREKRLEAVRRKLLETDLRIEEVAIACGYRDANYLKNQFKRAFGLSMRKFRQSRGRAGAASPTC